jgi:hypothetical protein
LIGRLQGDFNMAPFNRILYLAAAGVLVALTASSGPASSEGAQRTIEHANVTPHEMNECSLQRRAISRHACQARLLRDEPTDTAENR